MPENLRADLRDQLLRSMKSRDRDAASVLRVVLAAVDNAEAVDAGTLAPAGALEESPVGTWAVDRPRRQLSEDEVRAVVEAVLADMRSAAAASHDGAWRHDREREIRLLESML